MVKKTDIVYILKFLYPIIPIAKDMEKKVVDHLHDYILVSYTAVNLAHRYLIKLSNVSELIEALKDFANTDTSETMDAIEKLRDELITKLSKKG
ncbi:hypothetical protein [Desulfurococcus amylolyticus]|uniref:Uncharacterized protein n=1 Tax=Desulfurococcus amylolyticus DSM 16532 TaxID=768672 RepID=I3XR55_DESAM|nr:hypothetical protein [Desulfurococcus amylolyticus]AFL66429.1 hypothetical protein Desfe_0525 [Desulfurococcus amylolyticus DSM 16532]